ncbi:MAG: hypothetical protein ABIO96_05480 [Nitrospiraceae bacterium]
MDRVLTHIISSTDARATGPDKWIAHCGAHGSKRHRDLSIRAMGDRILLHCFAGCETAQIVAALGLEMSDLFTDKPTPRQRQEVMHRRSQEQATQQAAAGARGRKTDLLKHAESLVQSARGLNIEAWTPAQLDKRLNVLADAYDVIEGDRHEQQY